MIKKGDLVTIQWYPWSSHPVTIEKEVVYTEQFNKMGLVTKMSYITSTGPIAEKINMKQQPAYLRVGSEIYQFNWKITKKMSEVKKPMKTVELQKFTDQGKTLIFKIPNFRGGYHTWALTKDYKKTLVNGKYLHDINNWKMDSVYLDKPYDEWTEHQKMINNDIRALHKMDKIFSKDKLLPPLFNNTLGEYLIDIIGSEKKLIQISKTTNKQFRRIKKKNLTILKKHQKRILHSHQSNVMSIGKKIPQSNLYPVKDYIVQITPSKKDLQVKEVKYKKITFSKKDKLIIKRKKEDGKKSYIKKDTDLVRHVEIAYKKVKPKTKNLIYRKVKSTNPTGAYKRIQDQFKTADLIIREWNSTEAIAIRRLFVREPKKGLKRPDTINPNTHLRMVCVKHITGEVKRVPQWKAEGYVSRKKDLWEYCDKQEWKRWVNKQAHLRKTQPKDNIVPGSTFSRTKGTRVRKKKGIQQKRGRKLQTIKILTVKKDTEGNEIPKKKRLTFTYPEFRYIYKTIISKGNGYWPAGTILGTKVEKIKIDNYKPITETIEYIPIKKYKTKTIYVSTYTAKKDQRVDEKEGIKLRIIRKKKEKEKYLKYRKRKEKFGRRGNPILTKRINTKKKKRKVTINQINRIKSRPNRATKRQNK